MQGAPKVGLLVIVFVALLYAGYAVLGHALGQAPPIRYFADFADAGGAAVGTPVTMAGVKIGDVREVRLLDPRRARLTLAIDPAVHIPTGSVARQGASLIGIGQNPVEIVAPKAAAAALPPDSVILGASASPFESYLPPEARTTLRELNATLAATRKILENKTLEKKLEAVLDGSAATMQKFSELSTQTQGLLARTDRMMGENGPQITAAVRSASLAMSDVRKSTALLSKLIESGKYQQQTTQLLDQLNATAKKADDLMASLNGFIGDAEVQANLKDTLSSVNKLSETGTRIAANTETISKNGITLSEKAIQLADKANAIADEARAALDKITGFFSKGGPKPVIPKTDVGLDLFRETAPNHWRTDLTARIALDKNFVDLGLYDAFETNKVILEYGNPVTSSLTYRYGIYASKPGVGVDFRVAPRVTLRTDLFDINNPRFDLRTRFDFGSGLVGWLGVERLFGRNAFVAGVGIRK